MKKSLDSLLQDSRGNVAVMVAAVMPLLIGAAGLGVDSISWALTKRELQRAADTAAISGASANLQDEDVNVAVERSLAKFATLSLDGTPAIERGPTAGPMEGDENAVRVVLQAKGESWFSSFFMDSPTIAVDATAAAFDVPSFCMVSLERTNTPGITFAGDANVDLDCGMTTNSRGNPAITAAGSAVVSATDVGAVGGLSQTTHFVEPIEFFTGQPALEDPYIQLPDPVVGSCSQGLIVQPNQTRTLNPGCFRGMNLMGNVSLNPGIYVINGSQLNFGAGANVRGEGVTFILTGSSAGNIATVDFSGHPHLELSAPTSGTYEGVLIYQDRRANHHTNIITGDATSIFDGAIYMPKQTVEFRGNGSLDADCLRIVSLRISFTGSSSAGSDTCAGSDDTLYGKKVKLIA